VIAGIVLVDTTMNAGRSQVAAGYHARLSGNGFPLDPLLPCHASLGEVLDFLLRVHFKYYIQHLLGGGLGPCRLVDLVGLELGEDIAQVVDPLLVQCLEGLEDKGRLRLPLLAGRFETGSGKINLSAFSAASSSSFAIVTRFELMVCMFCISRLLWKPRRDASTSFSMRCANSWWEAAMASVDWRILSHGVWKTLRQAWD